MDLLGNPVWRQFWYPVCFADEISAGPVARTLLGVPVVVWPGGPHEVAAAVDRCPHRDAALSRGWVCGERIVCGYHGWQYEPDGTVAHIPQIPDMRRFPARFSLASLPARIAHGAVWVCLDETTPQPLPDLPDATRPGWRFVREFDEEWATHPARLMENSLDPAHVAFVHKNSFGDPGLAEIGVPDVERTDYGLIMRLNVDVKNPDIAWAATGSREKSTTRITTTRFFAPFLRSSEFAYANGTVHTIITAATPVDDSHLRLVQWAVRNDSEQDAPAVSVVAFDRQVTVEDRLVLEGMRVPYNHSIDGNSHIKVDRATVAIRRIYGDILDGTWPGLAGRVVDSGRSTPVSMV
ncbi:MAG: Rieske 2Fe-2S domain-containing protein [Frankia sp.]